MHHILIALTITTLFVGLIAEIVGVALQIYNTILNKKTLDIRKQRMSK